MLAAQESKNWLSKWSASSKRRARTSAVNWQRASRVATGFKLFWPCVVRITLYVYPLPWFYWFDDDTQRLQTHFLTTFPTHFYRVWYTDLFIRSCLGHLSNMSRFNWVRWVRKDLWTGRQIVTRTSCALSGAKIQTSTKTQQIASCLGAVSFWWSTFSIRSLRLVPSDLLNTEKLVLLFDWYGSIYSYRFLRLESCFLR